MIKSEIKATEQVFLSTHVVDGIEQAIEKSWSKIAPFWPLKNLIAVNPVRGFEDLTFKAALKEAQTYFQQKDLPELMKKVNCETIKWLQVFFDEGQSTIQMPLRTSGLLRSVLALLPFDAHFDLKKPDKRDWFKNLSAKPEIMIEECLLTLGIAQKDHEQFLTLMLTTLPGWAAHIQYRTSWADAYDNEHPHPVSHSEYLAIRLVLTCLLWPTAKDLLVWYKKARESSDERQLYSEICNKERAYKTALIKDLKSQVIAKKSDRVDVQLVFCIDVRSEPFRKALESKGNYETFGFAGFFGLPVSIQNAVTGEAYASCPVLLKPLHTIVESPLSPREVSDQGYQKSQMIKKLYQSLKYNFTTPFSLVEIMGFFSGVWMALRSFFPRLSTSIGSKIKSIVNPDYRVRPDIDSIPFDQQIAYAASALKMIGLIDNFAPLIVFCGHGSQTQNNAYATALDCGACGGRHGASNARILADILNKTSIREALQHHDIRIPTDSYFVAAEHNTTRDSVELFPSGLPLEMQDKVLALKGDLEAAQTENSLWRCVSMQVPVKPNQAVNATALRSEDWAQIRPEWGLAQNASFIIGPRSLTKNIHLKGRSFLHSYEWEQDKDCSILTTILTAPMVVAQWINAQYFFSTLDNVAFGGGSKITKNITGKIGIMQGNASDLMHGLPLQSVLKSDDEPYHETLRLLVVVCAPRAYLDRVIQQQEILQKLFGNGWVHLVCREPETESYYQLNTDLSWSNQE